MFNYVFELIKNSLYNQHWTTANPCPLTKVVCIWASFVYLCDLSCGVAMPFQYPVAHRKSLKALWLTTALLTPISSHVLWNIWCSSCSVLQSYLSNKILSMSEISAKLSPISLEPGSHPQNILAMVEKQAGPTAQRWSRDPSPWRQVNSVAQEAPLEQGISPAQHIHFRKMRCNAVAHRFFCLSPASPAGQHQTFIMKALLMVWDHVKSELLSIQIIHSPNV